MKKRISMIAMSLIMAGTLPAVSTMTALAETTEEAVVSTVEETKADEHGGEDTGQNDKEDSETEETEVPETAEASTDSEEASDETQTGSENAGGKEKSTEESSEKVTAETRETEDETTDSGGGSREETEPDESEKETEKLEEKTEEDETAIKKKIKVKKNRLAAADEDAEDTSSVRKKGMLKKASDSATEDCDIDPEEFVEIDLDEESKTKFEYQNVDTVVLPDVAKEGYTFLYWTADPDDEDAETYEAGAVYEIKTDDDRLYAVFEDEDGDIIVEGNEDEEETATPSEIPKEAINEEVSESPEDTRHKPVKQDAAKEETMQNAFSEKTEAVKETTASATEKEKIAEEASTPSEKEKAVEPEGASKEKAESSEPVTSGKIEIPDEEVREIIDIVTNVLLIKHDGDSAITTERTLAHSEKLQENSKITETSPDAAGPEHMIANGKMIDDSGGTESNKE